MKKGKYNVTNMSMYLVPDEDGKVLVTNDLYIGIKVR